MRADVVFQEDAFRGGGEGIPQPEKALSEEAGALDREDLDARFGAQGGEGGAPLEPADEEEKGEAEDEGGQVAEPRT